MLMTTIEMTTGLKKTVRKKVIPGSFWLISSAQPSAAPHCSGTTMTTNRMMLASARQNSGSLEATA